MIKYKKYQNKNDKNAAYGKWFGRAVHELMEFDEFIEHMAKHHCVYSEGTLRGVLIEMEICLRELLLEGKAVRLDDLGIFALSIANKKGGAREQEDYTASLITGVRMNLFLGKRFRARELYKDAKFREADKYIGDGNYYEPDSDAAQAASEGDSQDGDSANTGNGSSSGNEGGQGQQSTYTLTIARTGSGTSTVKDDSENSINGLRSFAPGTNLNIEIIPAEGHVPTARINDNGIELTENDGVYVGTFQMPARVSLLELNSGSDSGDGGADLDKD